jgi:hypothetical protein
MASTLCPASATPGGFGATYTSSPTGGACSRSVTMSIPDNTEEGKLIWTPANSGYPSGLTLSTLTTLNASVSNVSNLPGDDPYFFLSFFDNSLAQNPGDQMILIESEPSTVVGGSSVPVDSSATEFDLYDNITNQYYDSATHSYAPGGQQDTHTLAEWLALDPHLSGDSINSINFVIGVGASCSGCADSVTVNSVAVVTSTPEPGTIVSVGTGLLCLGTGLAFRRRKLVQAV